MILILIIVQKTSTSKMPDIVIKYVKFNFYVLYLCVDTELRWCCIRILEIINTNFFVLIIQRKREIFRRIATAIN